MKTCKQCGELKAIANFRKYYGGRKGYYKMCTECEKINSRAKYLSKKNILSDDERQELESIYKLYDVQRKAGLQPPTRQERTVPLGWNFADMIAKYQQQLDDIQAVIGDEVDAPYDLVKWLHVDLTKDPEYYLDDIYEKLKSRYRPCKGLDIETLLPIYDDAYKKVLDCILERFNNYEDQFYDKE